MHLVQVDPHPHIPGLFTASCETCDWEEPAKSEAEAVTVAARHITETEKEAA